MLEEFLSPSRNSHSEPSIIREGNEVIFRCPNVFCHQLGQIISGHEAKNVAFSRDFGLVTTCVECGELMIGEQKCRAS